jgi:hypothetical protein
MTPAVTAQRRRADINSVGFTSTASAVFVSPESFIFPRHEKLQSAKQLTAQTRTTSSEHNHVRQRNRNKLA